MKQVVVLTSDKNGDLLRRELLNNKYGKTVLVRMSPYETLFKEKFDIEINSADSMYLCSDKLRIKSILGDLNLPNVRYFSSSKELRYPYVLKSRCVNEGKHDTVFFIESVHDHRTAAAFSPLGSYVELFTKFTSEYRLFCTKKEVFFSVKKVKQDEENPIITSFNSVNVKNFIKPKLFAKISNDACRLVKAIGLDIGVVDIGYISSGDVHQYCIHGVCANPKLTPNIISEYTKQIDKIIKERS